MAAEWEHVCGLKEGQSTERMKVPGGWLYWRQTSPSDPGAYSTAMTFVPEPAPQKKD